MQRFLRTRLIVVIAAGIISITLALWFTVWRHHRPIRAIRITGCQLLDSAEILHLLPDSVLTLADSPESLATLATTLLRHPFVQHVSFHHGFHTLRIHIVERQPLAFLLIENSVPKLLLPDTIVEYRRFRIPLSLPVLAVPTPQSQHILELLQQFPHLLAQVSEFVLSPPSATLRFLPAGTSLWLSAATLAEQLRKAAALYQLPSGQLLIRTQPLLDLRWKNRVITVKRAHRWHRASRHRALAAIPTGQY